jgi:hypothetical protein
MGGLDAIKPQFKGGPASLKYFNKGLPPLKLGFNCACVAPHTENQFNLS